MSAVATSSVRGRVLPWLLAGSAGFLFGVGLLISGMTRPDRVIGFLDATRAWDPSLAFVMIGGIAAYSLVFRALTQRSHAPWFGGILHLPTRRDIDRPLVLGASLFGIGWGLGGYCPGPGLVSAAGGSGAAIGFVVAMLFGMWLQHRTTRA